MDRTLGQIAYEANRAWNNWRTPWRELPPGEHAQWEYIAQAVAQAVAPLPVDEP